MAILNKIAISSGKKKHTYLIVIFLIVVSCIAFGRIAGNDFINFDDNAYITENNYIQLGINPESIKWAFTTFVMANWHPITWLSHMLDWILFGANASGHHLVSLLLHIGAVIFLFLFLKKTTNNLWPSAFVSALFALHPLRVESVAWAAERKDVLSMFFGMACLYAYAFYAESSKISRYFLCLILFALALLSKPMLVTLPFVLLLIDYWPLGRWQKALAAPAESRYKLAGRLVWEKAPFYLLTIASSIITYWVQKVVPEAIMPHVMRAANAIVSYVLYLGKTFWPVNLAVYYPYKFFMPLGEIVISGLILILITAAVLYYIKKAPFLLVGWFWYLGTLVPVIGLIHVGQQEMADRYTYLPSIGIAIMLAWGLPLLFRSENTRKKILFPTAIAVLAILVVLTWQQCGYWKNSITLYSHTLQATNDSYPVHDNFGHALYSEGRIEEAIYHYNKAIRITPNYYRTYYSRGIAYDKLGQYQRAIEDYNQVIRLQPDYADVYNNRGVDYVKFGQQSQAIQDYNEAISLKPDFALAYYNRGLAYIELGHYQQSIEDFNKAISLNPNDARAYNNRGLSYDKLGKYQLAIEDFNKAIILIPYYTKAYINRGNIYLSNGNKKLGCNDAQKACEFGNCKILETAKSIGDCH